MTPPALCEAVTAALPPELRICKIGEVGVTFDVTDFSPVFFLVISINTWLKAVSKNGYPAPLSYSIIRVEKSKIFNVHNCIKIEV